MTTRTTPAQPPTLLRRRAALAQLTAAAALLGACGRAAAFDISRLWPEAGSGLRVEERRRASGFTGLRLSTAARVEIRQGNVESVVVEADDNTAPLIDVFVEGGTLVVEDSRRFKSSLAKVTVTLRQLDSLTTSNSVAVVCDRLVAPKLAITMAGSSAVHLKAITSERVRAALGGSAALMLVGSTRELALTLGGSSNVSAGGLEARAVTVQGGGSSQAAVWGTDALSVALGGSAGVGYYGKPSLTSSSGGTATLRSLGEPPVR